MRSILLDATYEPLGIISWQKAFKLTYELKDKYGSYIIKSKADVLYSYPDRKISTMTENWDWPAIVILKKPCNRKRVNKHVNPSTKSILVRDLYKCQYCGVNLTNKTGTKDHVIPESKGGPSTWDNLVAACRSCQMKKDDQYPDECGMYPMTKPRAPTFEERFYNGVKISNSTERTTWKIGLKKQGLQHLLQKADFDHKK